LGALRGAAAQVRFPESEELELGVYGVGVNFVLCSSAYAVVHRFMTIEVFQVVVNRIATCMNSLRIFRVEGFGEAAARIEAFNSSQYLIFSIFNFGKRYSLPKNTNCKSAKTMF